MRRATLLLALVAALVCVGGLILAAAKDERGTAAAPGVPDNLVVAKLASGQTACQAPLRVTARFQAVDVWLFPARRVKITIRAFTTGRLLRMRDVVAAPTSTGLTTFRLSSSLSEPSAPIKVCLTNGARQPFELEGGPPTGRSGRLSIDGQQTHSAIALLFLRPHPRPLLSLLPSVFRRASLLKFSWIGPWTFWLLGGALIAMFALVGVAVAQAESADIRGDRERDSGP